MMKISLRAVAAAIAFAALCGSPAVAAETEVPAASTAPVPGGTYRLDKSHASLIFRVSHIGFSNYTGRFATFDATLDIDPENPAAAKLEASVDPASLAVENPPEGFLESLLGPDWFDAAKFPEMTFRSTKIEMTGDDTARVTGDLMLHGVTLPVAFDATFNGGYAGHPFEPNARIGFSARGGLSRSAFGIAYGVPEEGSTMGVGDAVEFIIEAEFTGPAWADAPKAE
ncbi:MAG: YceI family protein [Parvibaculum sp.]|uniref:YceI family protein n=1 Tax=Parvibaculum sp. TaxID=2024848 RepID=UPI00271D3E2A|nr:YceI family protein [Parvibaculum sp.]MDO8838578.1 YceI family protein [Parvibaculum sp.]